MFWIASTTEGSKRHSQFLKADETGRTVEADTNRVE